MNDDKNFLEEIERKKRKIIENSSLKQRLVFCFFKNFDENFCDINENKLRTIEEKLFYSIFSNKKVLEDKEISQRIKQLSLNNILDLIAYLKYFQSIGKNDNDIFKLSPIEAFVIKALFPNLEIEESKSYLNNKKYLSILASKMLKKEKISQKEIINALKEIDELIDIYILEQAYFHYFSNLIDIDKNLLKIVVQSILNVYNYINVTLKIFICCIFIPFFGLIIHKYKDFITKYINIIGFGTLITIGIWIFWLFFTKKISSPKDIKELILYKLKHFTDSIFDYFTIKLINIIGIKLNSKDIKILKKLKL